LIYGNVACYNGGGGIQFDSANNVTVANNSTYANYLDLENSGTWRGEGSWWGSSNSNVVVSNLFQNVTSGPGINSGSGSLASNEGLNLEATAGVSGANVFTQNDSYPTAASSGSSNQETPTGQLNVNPLFVSLGSLPSSSTNTPPCNLQLQSGSPAIGTGTAEPYIPRKAPLNMGA
jgi:hypothetical protein